MNRDTMLQSIKETKEWDLIIIGGGATGLWCALDGASRGYKTLLLEKGDFAEGTSSRSTKLLHGGLRYLKQGRLGLIHEGLIERGYIARNAPHLFTERAFLLPFYNVFDKPYYKLGMILYDFLAGKLILKKHRLLSREEALQECPTLKSEGLIGGAIYYDGQFDDARFAIELAKTATFHGATLLNYCKVESLIKKNEKVVGVEAKELSTNEPISVYGKALINATGIFTDEIRELDEPSTNRLMVLSRGSHITIDKKFHPSETALIVPKTGDKRVIFVIPWQEKVLIGTTESVVNEPSNNPKPSNEEIEFLLSHAKEILNPYPKKEDIQSAFAGIRPLVKSNQTKSSSKLSRNHEIIISKSGLVTIVGGKWTTGRKMAEETINKAFKKPLPCKTKNLPLHKTDETSDLNKIVHRALNEEMALTPSDILARRTRILFLETKKALSLAPEVIRLMSIYFKKDSTWEDDELNKFKEYAKSYWT
jgi:glycerol-3-phosphate dehydrogenase